VRTGPQKSDEQSVNTLSFCGLDHQPTPYSAQPHGSPEALRLVVEAPAGPDWERINDGRHKLFEGPRKPELTEAHKALAKK
jgi:hypothetical protein